MAVKVVRWCHDDKTVVVVACFCVTSWTLKLAPHWPPQYIKKKSLFRISPLIFWACLCLHNRVCQFCSSESYDQTLMKTFEMIKRSLKRSSQLLSVRFPDPVARSASYLQLRFGHFSTLLDVQRRERVPYRLEEFGFWVHFRVLPVRKGSYISNVFARRLLRSGGRLRRWNVGQSAGKRDREDPDVGQRRRVQWSLNATVF